MAEGKAKSKAPALTTDNVTKAVEGVKNWRSLGAWLNVPLSKLDEIERKSSNVSECREKVILFWMENDPTPSWRRILWALDVMREHHIAESIRQHCEPLTDPTLTRDNVTTTLHTVPTKRWFELPSLVYHLGVPYSKRDQIRDQSIPEDEKRTAAVDYWLGMVPRASWQRLAGAVYRLEEEAALEEARKYFQRPRDPTLTLNSLHTATKGVRNWDELGYWIDIPQSKLVEIMSQFSSDDQQLRALLEVWLQTHPAPTWSLIAEALYQMEEYDLLKRVREQYITGTLEKRLAACERAIKEKGSMDQTVMQGVFLGQPRSGKSSLMKRLVRRPLPVNSSSTGVAEGVLRVDIQRISSTTVQVSGLEWSELGDLDDEAIALLQEMPEPQQKSLLQRIFQKASDSMKFERSSALILLPEPPQKPRESTGTKRQVTSPQSKLQQTPSSEAQVPLPPTMFKPPKQFLREAVQNKRPASLLPKLLNEPWTLYLTDAGGQPEFQELLPALVSGPSVFFLVFRLDADLSKRFPVVYVSSTGESTVPYESSFTVEENLLQSLASIASSGAYTRLKKSRRAEAEPERISTKPKVLFIGTHKDKVSKERMKQIDRHLQQLVRGTAHFKEGIVHFASESSMIFTINNLSESEEDVQQIRAAIERLGQEVNFQVNTPYPWLIFGIIIRQMNIPLLSRDQCLKVAKKCSIRHHKELDNLLWFHHTQTGILRYFQSEDVPELHDVVIIEPRYLFDHINNLLVETFTFENAPPAVREEFIKKGIFPADVFEEITARDTSELLPPAKRLKLFEYLHIIAALEENGVVTKYFMPCILAHAETSEAAQSSGDHCSPLVPPLMIGFASGYCPKGLFGSLVVYLLGKRPQSSLEWELVEEQIFRDEISLSVSRCDNVVLKLLPTHLSIGITCSAQSSTSTVSPHDKVHLATMCSDVCQCIENGIEKVSQTLHYKHNAEYCLAFACPEVQNGEETHPAAVRHDLRGRYLQCTRQPKNRWDLPPDCLIWFTQEDERAPVDVDPTPACRNTLSSAIALVPANSVEVCDVLTACGFSRAHWDMLAARLSKDIDVEAIRQAKSTPERCLHETVRQWLQKDTEASWGKLANAVAKIGDYGDAVVENILSKTRTGGSS